MPDQIPELRSFKDTCPYCGVEAWWSEVFRRNWTTARGEIFWTTHHVCEK